MHLRARTVTSVALGLVLGASVAAPVLAAEHGVTIEGFAFSPGRVTVTVGDTVTWTNADGASHTATADDGSFDTGGIPGGSTATIRFTTAGEFRYLCTIHPDMTGRIIVREAASGGGGSGGAGATPPATSTEPTSGATAGPGISVPGFALLAFSTLVGALGWRRRAGRR